MKTHIVDGRRTVRDDGNMSHIDGLFYVRPYREEAKFTFSSDGPLRIPPRNGFAVYDFMGIAEGEELEHSTLEFHPTIEEALTELESLKRRYS